MIELIITNTPIADFQKERLRKDDTFSHEDTLNLSRTYEATRTHRKQSRSMQNTTNEATKIAMQAIGLPTYDWKAKNASLLGEVVYSVVKPVHY